MSKPVRKPFDPILFAETDRSARNAVMDYIGASGLFVQDNPDTYGPDLIVYKGFKPAYYVEVEIKKVWKQDQDTFPWATVQLPGRKVKFTELGVMCEFFILREDMKMAIVIADHVVASSPQNVVKNKYVTEGEIFVTIDLSECDVVNLEE